MKNINIFLWLLMASFLCLHGCTYRKGDAYRYTGSEDDLRFIVRKAGRGEMILNQVRKLTIVHTSREDDYRFVYLSDSSSVPGQKTILLFHSEMPDYEEDFLSKGYLGAFGTKEIVIYMIVTADDFDSYFTPAGPVE